jgi:hypothetical protein
MLNLLPYISTAGAFFAALIAIIGKPKWDPDKSGLRKLTPTGRIAATLATVALVSTSILTWSAQRAADERRSQRERIDPSSTVLRAKYAKQ